MTLRGKINSVIRHPSILKDVIQGKSPEEIRDKIRAKVRSQDVMGKGLGEEVPQFISHLKKTSPYHIINPNDKPKLNRLCYVDRVRENVEGYY